MSHLLLDPGHGGLTPAGRSTPIGVRGPRGLFEKDVTLDLALRVGNALRARGHRVALTRDRDENPSLGARADLATQIGASALVSLHLHDRPGGTPCAWVHDGAAAEAHRLAGSFGGMDRRSGPFALLHPERLRVPSALLELGSLATDADEARWRNPDERAATADQVAESIHAWAAGPRPPADSRIDIWNEVPLVPQVTGMSCWAAAAAMIIGWRECLPVDPEEVARGAGRWREYRAGLLPSDAEAVAKAWGLQGERHEDLDLPTLVAILRQHGPVWLGEADPGLHVVTVTGLVGDGSPEGTFVRVNDPWPQGRGERYSLPFARLADNFRAVRRLAGFPARILHAGARKG